MTKDSQKKEKTGLKVQYNFYGEAVRPFDKNRKLFKGLLNKSFQLEKEASNNLKDIFPDNHNSQPKSYRAI